MKPIEIPGIAKYILFVDDEERFVRSGLTLILEEEGFSVFGYSCGKSAIDDIESGLVKYDLAIIDYHLRNLSGEEVIQTSRKYNPRVPIIGLSGWGNYHMSGTNRSLSKPIKIYELFNAIIETTTNSSFRYKSNEDLGY